MPIPPARLLKYILASMAALVAAGPNVALAQAPDSVISQPGTGPASTFRTDRPSGPDVGPSDGVGVFDRMGAKLPDLPPEKDYKGPIDEAYG
ncbi:sel1 repeat family protein, partial [Rhizobium ruizarguesonis]